ncbi:hypothetical protein P9112_014069 [Eukaryota sp. TZLM1-RC]
MSSVPLEGVHSYLLQVKGLTKKNFLVYFRAPHILLEVVFAIYFLGILLFINYQEDQPKPLPDQFHDAVTPLPWNLACMFSEEPDCVLLSYAPSDDLVAQSIANYLSALGGTTALAFASEQEMNDALVENPSRYAVGFVLHSSEPNSYNYTIRVQNNHMGENESNWDISPYLSFQTDLTSAILYHQHGQSLTINLLLKHFPTHRDPMPIGSNQITLPIYLTMGSMFFVTSYITAVITDKEKFIKQTLRCIGMRLSCYWLSNYIVFAFVGFLVSLLWSFGCLAFNIIPASILYLFIPGHFMFLLAIMSFMSLFSLLFKNVKVAIGTTTTVHLILSFGGLFIIFLLFTREEKHFLENISNLFPYFNYFDFVFNLMTGVLFNESKLWSYSANPDGRRTVSDNFWLLVFNFVLFTVLTLYFDFIVKTEFDSSKKFSYIFSKNHWKSVFDLSQPKIDSSVPALQVQNLVKEFKLPKSEVKEKKRYLPKGERVETLCTAVNDVSFTIPMGSTFAVLGKNGAGKTTAVNCAVGALSITSGNVSIAGMDVTKDMDTIRKLIAYVPQKDILMDQLSIIEHIELWGSIKGIPFDVARQRGFELLRSVRLESDCDKRSNELSGGMKRKLQLCCAFVGEPSFIFLDEITTGVDPDSRHQIWNLLSKKKASRQHSVLLITHYIEEAEVMSDDLVIMASAKIRCQGSPAELAIKHGSDYLFTFVKTENFVDGHVVALLNEFTGDVKVRNSTNQELAVSIPTKHKEKFSLLVSELENRSNQLGFSSFGIQTSTLEDIYLKVVETYQPEASGDV